MVWDSYIRLLPCHDSSFSLFGVKNSPLRVFCYRFIAAPNSSWGIKFLLFLMFSNCNSPYLQPKQGHVKTRLMTPRTLMAAQQPAAVAVPVAIPAAQPVHVSDADVVSCSYLLRAHLLSFCCRWLACFAGRCSIMSKKRSLLSLPKIKKK